ncbi:membrane protein [Tupanvirus deep ocean]|uniref:Membrane protein n=2 Tax=Tupanvirus TaxID=2094720 RepID=A0AC62AA23_9VIRU|nr:membrane protein [Tupanvirus deep ocean]QKU34498.1 membrane protein [Tupanvirus deep ocean]
MSNNAGMLHTKDAKLLAEINKTEPIWEESTPRWLLKLIQKRGIENTTFRINKVNSINKVRIDGHEYGSQTLDNIDYHNHPAEIEIVPIETIVKIPSKVYDVLNYPHNQMNQQIRLTIENIYEQQEKFFINNSQTGLITYCTKNDRAKEYEIPISPNMLDDLLGMVWNRPTFYLMHPAALVDFCKACNSQSLNTGSMELFGYQFVTWRGLPIITSDKIPYEKGTRTFAFLIRSGENDMGVVQLYNITPTKSGYPGVFVETSMTDNLGSVNTRVTLYTNIAVLSKEAIACAIWIVE